ncbi:MAG: HAMP domain-containing sensor histidine kinase [Candidatus Sulfobium sp.]|jgi:signal transduction histidine kinase
MSVVFILRIVRYILVVAVMALIWVLLGMVYVDRFIPPFNHLVPFLMPWTALNAIPYDASVAQRMAMMRGTIYASNKLANYALGTMIASFGVFSIYLTLVYQQKQRRARENRMLLLKNQEIARRNEFIRYISATIGHEFKNNLGRIKRRIDLLPDIPGDARTRLDDNLEKLFADIDIFKKISDERESGLIDFARVNLRDILVELGQHYADLAEFRFGDRMHVPAIFASQTLLKTVFENLVDNAIKYKKPGQARARISVSWSVDVDVRRKYVSLSFRDEGIGMDEQEADRCFYKWKGNQEGWGQGLYFVKYVIGLHAGKIRVGKEYTAPGAGTEIIINLPFVEETLNV